MDADPEFPVHAVRSLTIAVWTLVFVTIIDVALTVGGWLVPLFFTSHVVSMSGGATHSSFPYSSGPAFHTLSLDQKVSTASMILVVRYERDGDRMKAVVADVLKKPAGGADTYEVGAEYPDGMYYPSEGLDHGSGEVVFFAGDPPTMMYSTTYDSHDRIGGLGQMPLAKLKELVASKSAKP